MSTVAADVPAEPYVIADHPVLDMLNTLAKLDNQLHDFWRTDQDVLEWLVRTGWKTAAQQPLLAQGVLLKAAATLREAVRALVEQRKAGGGGDLDGLNGFLRSAVSYPQLTWGPGQVLQLQRNSESASAEQYLAPLAEAAATLLVEGDFSLIRPCEHPDCVLWFYDRTKSHRRRWCSMATCGNRHKVAEFRKRKQQDA